MENNRIFYRALCPVKPMGEAPTLLKGNIIVNPRVHHLWVVAESHHGKIFLDRDLFNTCFEKIQAECGYIAQCEVGIYATFKLEQGTEVFKIYAENNKVCFGFLYKRSNGEYVIDWSWMLEGQFNFIFRKE